MYGTLRSGGPAAGLLGGGTRLGDASVAGRLYDVGGRFPALVTGGGGEVHGEVWLCDASVLPGLDAYEGVAEGLFQRERVEAGGAEALTYTAGPRLLPHLREHDLIPDGSWPRPARPGR